VIDNQHTGRPKCLLEDPRHCVHHPPSPRVYILTTVLSLWPGPKLLQGAGGLTERPCVSHLSDCVCLCVQLCLQEAGLSLGCLGGGKVNTRQQRRHLGAVKEEEEEEEEEAGVGNRSVKDGVYKKKIRMRAPTRSDRYQSWQIGWLQSTQQLQALQPNLKMID